MAFENMVGIIAPNFKSQTRREEICGEAEMFFKRTEGKWCAAHDFTDLINGDMDYKICDMITPWDRAGGVFIYEELGGHVMHQDCSAYDPTSFPAPRSQSH